MIESNNRTEVDKRLATILDIVTQTDGGSTSSSPAGCGWAVVGAVAGCVAVQPLFCVGGGIVSACECLPLFVDEFKETECPGFG